MTAAVPGGVEILPGVEPRIARIHRHRIELPLQRTVHRIERLQEAGTVEVVARADQHVIADHERSHGREVLLLEARDLLVPALLAGLRFQTDEVVVRRLHVEPVAVHAHAAIADMRRASRLPEVVPDFVAVARIERPCVVGRRGVQDAVHHQDRPADVRALVLGGPDTAHDGRRRTRPARRATVETCRPGEREMPHVRRVDLLELAVSLAV